MSPRPALLTAALGFAQIQWHGDQPPAASALATYMNSWRGFGDVVVGMMRQDYEVDVSGGPDGWSATFLRGRQEGGAVNVLATAHDAKPWRAVQAAAWMALRAASR
jgi:hypothetical protein